MSAPEPLMTADDVALWLKVPRLRVYELAREGRIPSVRLGRTMRFSRPAVERFLAEGGTNSAVVRASSDAHSRAL